MTIRGYQVEAIAKTNAAVQAGHRSICIVAPTGAGKTMIGSTIACSAAEYDQRTLWLAHRQELVEQAQAKLPPDVIVTTVQALLASGDRPPADVVVFDEAHHYVAEQWGAIAEHYRDAIRLGLTATPERSDGTPLGDMFTALVEAASYSELLAGGWIVPCEVFAPESKSKELAMTVAEAVDRYSHGRQTIVFCATVAEAQACARDLMLHGAACVDGETPHSTRSSVVADFRAGRIRIVTNVYVFTEGFDAPNAAVCVLARGAGHASTYLQMVGRVLRPAPGKDRATLVDLCGSCNVHGLPTDDRTYSLSGDAIRARASTKTLWHCRACGLYLPNAPSNRRCPQCSNPMSEPEALRVKKREMQRKQAIERSTHDEKRAYWEQLLSIVRERGYKPGWAYYRFKGRFGHAPPRA